MRQECEGRHGALVAPQPPPRGDDAPPRPGDEILDRARRDEAVAVDVEREGDGARVDVGVALVVRVVAKVDDGVSQFRERVGERVRRDRARAPRVEGPEELGDGRAPPVVVDGDARVLGDLRARVGRRVVLRGSLVDL